jgi:hypothetical protein
MAATLLILDGWQLLLDLSYMHPRAIRDGVHPSDWQRVSRLLGYETAPGQTFIKCVQAMSR